MFVLCLCMFLSFFLLIIVCRYNFIGYELTVVDDQLIVDYEAVKLTVNKISERCDELSQEEREALAAFLVEHGKEPNEYVCLC